MSVDMLKNTGIQIPETRRVQIKTDLNRKALRHFVVRMIALKTDKILTIANKNWNLTYNKSP